MWNYFPKQTKLILPALLEVGILQVHNNTHTLLNLYYDIIDWNSNISGQGENLYKHTERTRFILQSPSYSDKIYKEKEYAISM